MHVSSLTQSQTAVYCHTPLRTITHSSLVQLRQNGHNEYDRCHLRMCSHVTGHGARDTMRVGQRAPSGKILALLNTQSNTLTICALLEWLSDPSLNQRHRKSCVCVCLGGETGNHTDMKYWTTPSASLPVSHTLNLLLSLCLSSDAICLGQTRTMVIVVNVVSTTD